MVKNTSETVKHQQIRPRNLSAVVCMVSALVAFVLLRLYWLRLG